jgi:GT2 family glycosyltransferase
MPLSAITVSIVSHGQNKLVNHLLSDLARHCDPSLRLIVTENVPDEEPLNFAGAFKRIVNDQPKGFGANHNRAFLLCETPFFCVLNPDIRLASDPFARLVRLLDDERIAAAGPLVRNPKGDVEDSARVFPTPAILLKKLFVAPGGPDYPIDTGPLNVDWLAGMCILFRSAAYRAAGGFDEKFFLYYEDVDLCRRFHASGYGVWYEPRAEVIHDARRASRKNLRPMFIHIASVMRYFLHPRT